jgi:hypothetical protein
LAGSRSNTMMRRTRFKSMGRRRKPKTEIKKRNRKRK